MAALEKIRSKSVMLLVVIGVALLAFIIGDFLNSGRSFFGAGTTVANVDGTKISIVDFQRRYEEANQQIMNSNQKVDPALVQSQVLEEMISEHLMGEEVEALNLDVTDAEVTEAMTGKTANYQIVQFAQQMGMESPAQLHELIFNPGKFNVPAEQVAELRAQWLKMEEQVVNSLKYQKLGVLLAGAIQANDLDKMAVAEEMSNASTVDMVNVRYSSLEDKDYPVSEEELKACYNEEKKNFEVDQELRKVHYIAVDIAPSVEDLSAATKMFASVDSMLRSTQGIDAVRVKYGDVSVAQKTVRLSDVDKATADFLAKSDAEAVSERAFRGDVHSVTKLLAKKMDVDSVKVSMLQVQGAKSVQDSVLNLLKSGKPFAEVADNKVAVGQEDMWMNLMQLGADDKSKEAKAKILAADKEYFILDSNDNGALIYKVSEKKAPKAMFDIAEVSYKVFPSEETIDNLRSGLQTYINTNNTSATFVENAVKSGYQPMQATISKDQPQVNRIESTRKGVQWAFGAEVGAVSPVYDKEGNDKMIAYCLDEIIPAGYMPLSDPFVKMEVERKARNSKKAEALLAKCNGKASDLAAFSTLMNAPVDTAVVVTFGQDFIPVVGGVEPALNGVAPYAAEGKFVGPVKGENGVFVYKVVKKEKSSSAMTQEQLSQRFAATYGSAAVSRMALDILKEGKDIENDLINFY